MRCERHEGKIVLHAETTYEQEMLDILGRRGSVRVGHEDSWNQTGGVVLSWDEPRDPWDPSNSGNR